MRILLSTSLAPLLLFLALLVTAEPAQDQHAALLAQKAEADALFAKGDYAAASRSYSKAIGEIYHNQLAFLVCVWMKRSH
jgi:hypothetical protein